MIIISYLPALWLILILAGIFCEAYFEHLVAIWFTPPALAALICGMTGADSSVQYAVFAAGTAFLLITRLALHLIHKSSRGGINIDGQKD